MAKEVLEGQKYCRGCGEKIAESAKSCPHCGAEQGGSSSEKSKTVALLLAVFIPGAGNMYIGEVGKGILLFFTSWLIIPWIYGIWDVYNKTKKW